MPLFDDNAHAFQDILTMFDRSVSVYPSRNIVLLRAGVYDAAKAASAK